VVRAVRRVHRWLLPDDREIGWTPYLWLVYLSFFFISWFFRPVPVSELLLSAVVLAVFLLLYFRSFWVGSRRRLWIAAATAGLGLVMTPINAGSIVFFIYAAASSGTVRPPRLALAGIAGIVAVALVQCAFLGLPLHFWFVAAVVGGFVGLANVYFSGVSSENAVLRLNQQEVRALTRDRERERIGRDLHDLLGQSLSLITLKAQLARRLVATDPKRAENELEAIEEQSRRVLEQVREAVRDYRRTGLTAEIADARLALSAREIRFEPGAVPENLPSDVEAELALVLREAVTNVLRHSNADTCRLSLGIEGSTVVFRFEDNGGPSRLTEGSGLSGMRRRVEGLGGRITFDAIKGLRIEARIPLDQETDRETQAA
jgi:two-component system sensor histidine kinase DesK